MSTEELQWTALLCKPSSQEAHHIIATELQASGLAIERRLFNVTPEQAIALVLQYPALKGRAAAERTPARHGAPSHELAAPSSASVDSGDGAEKTAELPEHIKAAQQHRQGGRVRFTSPSSSPFARLEGGFGQRNHRILDHIQQLAQGSRMHPPPTTTTHASAAGAAGSSLPQRLSLSQPSVASVEERQGASGVRTSAPPPPPLLRGGGSRTTAPRSAPRGTLASRRSPLSFPLADSVAPGLALDTLLDHPALEDPLVQRHVEHLVQDGTALVFLVRGVDAVARLAALCGPDSVDEARRTAPHCWTARFGQDEVRNGVYAPRTAADAQSAVSSLFPLNTSDRTARPMQAKSHVHTLSPFPAIAPETNVMAARLTYASVLPVVRAQVDASKRLSYYTGVQSVTQLPMPVVVGDTACASAAPLASIGRAVDNSAEVSGAHMMLTPTALRAHSATTRFSSVAPYPERQERLDEFDNVLRQRAVGC